MDVGSLISGLEVQDYVNFIIAVVGAIVGWRANAKVNKLQSQRNDQMMIDSITPALDELREALKDALRVSKRANSLEEFKSVGVILKEKTQAVANKLAHRKEQRNFFVNIANDTNQIIETQHYIYRHDLHGSSLPVQAYLKGVSPAIRRNIELFDEGRIGITKSKKLNASASALYKANKEGQVKQREMMEEIRRELESQKKRGELED